MFNNSSTKQFDAKDEDDDNDVYKNEEDEAPTVNLNDTVIDKSKNPFDKLFDKQVDKFKYIIPSVNASQNKAAT
jgi:hypothetical protein